MRLLSCQHYRRRFRQGCARPLAGRRDPKGPAVPKPPWTVLATLACQRPLLPLATSRGARAAPAAALGPAAPCQLPRPGAPLPPLATLLLLQPPLLPSLALGLGWRLAMVAPPCQCQCEARGAAPPPQSAAMDLPTHNAPAGWDGQDKLGVHGMPALAGLGKGTDERFAWLHPCHHASGYPRLGQ